jgi:hypothetical protein
MPKIKEKISSENVPVKPKRGRAKAKKADEEEVLVEDVHNNILLSIENEDKVPETPTFSIVETKNEIEDEIEDEIEEDSNVVLKPPSRKRGRKPKGGKIVQVSTPTNLQPEEKPNVILHLKCSSADLFSTGYHDSNFSTSNIESFNFNKNELSYEVLSSNPFDSKNEADQGEIIPTFNDQNDTKEIWRKLKILKHNLHMNNIVDKKSACFWCSHDFDSPPIYIPKYFMKDSYHVYGCFCSPECSVAYLMEENIDSSIKFERYHLLNHIYSKIYDYKKNIKPAPNPHYMLEKFYGNLNIQEYRSLLNSERLFLIVDKPLTRILPEFHEDNDDFIINHKIIPSNTYQVKNKTKNSVPQKKPQTKTNIMSEKFGFNSVSQ